MPNGGSENQIESSDLTTTSFGELSGLPSNLSISTVIEPSYSVRVTRLASCSQVTSRPWRSRVLPFEKFDGLRKTLTRPVSSSQRIMRLLGMSLHSTQRASPNHTGPSLQRMPVASRSTLALNTRYLAKLGSRIFTAGSGYCVLGSQPPRVSFGMKAVAAAAAPAPRTSRRVTGMAFLLGLMGRVVVERQR